MLLHEHYVINSRTQEGTEGREGIARTLNPTNKLRDPFGIDLPPDPSPRRPCKHAKLFRQRQACIRGVGMRRTGATSSNER